TPLPANADTDQGGGVEFADSGGVERGQVGIADGSSLPLIEFGQGTGVSGAGDEQPGELGGHRKQEFVLGDGDLGESAGAEPVAERGRLVELVDEMRWPRGWRCRAGDRGNRRTQMLTRGFDGTTPPDREPGPAAGTHPADQVFGS